MTFELSDLILIRPELVLLCLTGIVLLLDLFLSNKIKGIGFGSMLCSLAIVMYFLLIQFGMPTAYTFDDMFIADDIGTLLKITMTLLVAFVLFFARPYLHDKKIPSADFYVLAMFSLLGMMVLVSARNLLLLYLGLELLTLPLIALVAIRRNDAKASEAAIKFFVMSAMASGFLLYGFSILYGVTKSLDLDLISEGLLHIPDEEYVLLTLSLVFIVVGVIFKIGVVPFHMWVPDVYAGAANPVTLLISTAPKIAGLGMALRLLMLGLPALQVAWQDYFIIAAILSIALGNLVAIVQTNIKRMLAYSSIAHMGYMILGLVTATPDGYAASAFYAIVYGFMALGSFAILVIMSHHGVDIEHVNDLKGLNSRNPWLAFMFMLILFSMAGIPPLAGFFAKISVLEALIQVHLVWLAVYALVFAVIGSYYYISVVKVMYFEEPIHPAPYQYHMDARMAISLNGLFVLFLGIVPGWLFTLCQRAFGM